ncbi:cobalamin B12-binding domain-containing protein [Acetobacteraceae bacterium KSS8]|uniref:Cobalamin B12-binding domain-containing protein n=1 Tax=Endosaccharibacter trunci TaxID=2812733 RepID=A0ABT1W3L9_9PROT|nr:cobalamin B12-binding domain-containing protein [Acetobacteraceae bacterium KSS8]
MSGVQHIRPSRPESVARPGGESACPAPSKGFPPAASRDAALRGIIEQRVVPHLLGLHGTQPTGGTSASGSLVGASFITGSPELSSRLSVELAVDAIDANPERVRARLDRLLEGGADPQELCLHVLAPAARHLGQLWVEDELDFVDVTLGTMRLERALHGLLPVLPPRRGIAPAHTILMMPLPGNQHTFGLSMAADFFSRAGWLVTNGATVALGLEQHLRAHEMDAVGLAVSCETQIDLLTDTLRMVRAASRNSRIRIVLGGPLFLVQPGMATRFDADLVVTDGARAPARLAALLPHSAARRSVAGACEAGRGRAPLRSSEPSGVLDPIMATTW